MVSEHLQGAADKACDHWHDDAGVMTHHVAFTLEVNANQLVYYAAMNLIRTSKLNSAYPDSPTEPLLFRWNSLSSLSTQLLPFLTGIIPR